MDREADDRQPARRELRRRRRRRVRRHGAETGRQAPRTLADDSPSSIRARHPAGTDLSGLHVDAQHSVPQVREATPGRTMAKTMAKTKTKANPYQAQEDALRLKQRELLDSYNRDKAAGNALPDDG